MCVVQTPSVSNIWKNGGGARPIVIGGGVLGGEGTPCIEYRQLTPLRRFGERWFVPPAHRVTPKLPVVSCAWSSGPRTRGSKLRTTRG